MRISEVVAGKASQDIVTITPDATVRELIALLTRLNVGAAVVSTDGTTLTGIASERDIVRKLDGNDAVLDASVAEIMTSNVVTCGPDSTLEEVRAIMTDGRFRHLPVVDGDRVVGVVSIGDIVKNHIDQLQFERDQLDHYVHQS
jgi:CBS domain-containing protein